LLITQLQQLGYGPKRYYVSVASIHTYFRVGKMEGTKLPIKGRNADGKGLGSEKGAPFSVWGLWL